MDKKEKRTELKVSAIENGTVIDHIPSRMLFRVIKILGLDNTDNMILFGTNLESQKYGTKGIIKVANKYFESEEINKIALVAPTASLIEIKEYKVINKKHVMIPDEIVKIVKCFNPNCITNHQEITSKFRVIQKEPELKIRCYYCEKTTAKDNMVFH